MSYDELFAKVKTVSNGLRALGLSADTHFNIYSQTRYACVHDIPIPSKRMLHADFLPLPPNAFPVSTGRLSHMHASGRALCFVPHTIPWAKTA